MFIIDISLSKSAILDLYNRSNPINIKEFYNVPSLGKRLSWDRCSNKIAKIMEKVYRCKFLWF